MERRPTPAAASSDAHAVVGDFEAQRALVERDADHAGTGFGVAYDVGQGLARDAVGRHLHGRGQGGRFSGASTRMLGPFWPYCAAVSRRTGTNEAKLVECGRPQRVDRPADVGDGRACTVPEVGE